jgi:hypothetical protein
MQTLTEDRSREWHWQMRTDITMDIRQETSATTLTLGVPQHEPHTNLAGSSRHRQGPGPICTLSSSGDDHSLLCSLVSPQCGSQPAASPIERGQKRGICWFFQTLESLAGSRLRCLPNRLPQIYNSHGKISCSQLAVAQGTRPDPRGHWAELQFALLGGGVHPLGGSQGGKKKSITVLMPGILRSMMP